MVGGFYFCIIFIMDGRLCNKCNVFKPWTNFYKKKNGLNGRCSICSKCSMERSKLFHLQNPEKRKEIRRKSYNKPEIKNKIRSRYLKNKFKLSSLEYEAMLYKQNNACSICLIDLLSLKRRPCIDHCHKTGKVRGLLCDGCNKAIGLFRDSVENIIRAKEYLVTNG